MAFSESLFRTCKYHPTYPLEGFSDLQGARQWVHRFVHWYNEAHRHSAIRYVTPADRHAGRDTVILQARHRIYQQARAQNPARWAGRTRNWQPVGDVWLNPETNLEATHDQAELEVA
ncbi:integrase core domain-containing protein [Alcaligenaceae bacterium CGII-47]|nr:integrase core domain-containing protein [Alcaligenaceae bacterium CGII-47]